MKNVCSDDHIVGFPVERTCSVRMRVADRFVPREQVVVRQGMDGLGPAEFLEIVAQSAGLRGVRKRLFRRRKARCKFTRRPKAIRGAKAERAPEHGIDRHAARRGRRYSTRIVRAGSTRSAGTAL